MPSHHLCLNFIGKEKNRFGIWNSLLFLLNFQGLIPLKMWLIEEKGMDVAQPI